MKRAGLLLGGVMVLAALSGLAATTVSHAARGNTAPVARGERITMKEAERRPDSDPDNPYHTFLFELNDGRVIDAAVGGHAPRRGNQ